MIGLTKKKPPPIRSLVGEGTTVQGTLQFTEGLRIDGRVEGDVVAMGDAHSILVISEKARIIGKVMAGHVIINGEVVGPIVCHEMLELQPKARITGDIRYDVLEMHPGAMVDGELRSLKSADKPQLKLAASNDA
jgi:cytoskeletal protein CcmA (bactofilin family)